MAEGGNTIGRANVELGADTSKLSAGLKEAQKQTEETVKAAEKSAQKHEAKASQGSDGFGFGAAKGAVLALIAAVQKLVLGIKEARNSGEEFAASMRDIESAFRTDTSAGLDPFTKRREEIEKTKQALLDQIRIQEQQRSLLQDIVGRATGEAESEAKRTKILQEATDAQRRNIENARESERKAAEEKQKEEQRKASDELRNSAARIRLAQKRAEDEAQVRIEAEIKANEKIEEDRRKRMEQTMRDLYAMQSEQFAALRGEINSLFNTGQLEIGINRLGALLEVLVQKTEDRR